MDQTIKQLYGCLMTVEMSIRQQVEWSKFKNKFIGYVDCGFSSDKQENLPVAKDALVY